MRFSSSALAALLLSVSVDAARKRTCAESAPNVLASAEPTEVDVLIVGGGATGAFAAVKLRDQGKTVAVVERSAVLGGHVNTFVDPATGAPIDYGVQAYISNNQTTDFFARFNITLAPAAQSPLPSFVADFDKGIITNASAPDLATLVDPITAYTLATLQFGGLVAGYYDLGDEVQADLLLPFGEFVAKNNITAEVLPVVWQFAQGVGDLMSATTLYVLQNFGFPHILGLQAGYQYAPSGNQAVFDAAAAFLGDSVLYGSTVQSTTRNGDNTTLVAVADASGAVTTFTAKKMLVTVPPTLDNLEGFDLSTAETDLFSQWENIPYFVGITADTGLPDLTSYINANITSPTTLPLPPLVWRLETVGVPGYQTVKVIGEADSDAAKELVVEAVGALTQTDGSSTTFAQWVEHDRLQLHVSPEAIKAGFYKKLYELQGQNGWFWTGNAWASDYSPLLWAFTEERVLPGLLA